jgi:hypothetical protein
MGGFAMMVASAALIGASSFASAEGIELRAARVCAGLGQRDATVQGLVTVDNLTAQTTGGGTVNLKQNGVDLGKVEKLAPSDLTDCIIRVMELLSRTENKPARP